jgi:hypothetical protein
MKSAIVILLVMYSCQQAQVETKTTVASQAPLVEASVPLAFAKDVQPILQSHCTPCHFKDGKMYARMPFDQSKTLVDFQAGILRRLKNEDELVKVREYLKQVGENPN